MALLKQYLSFDMKLIRVDYPRESVESPCGTIRNRGAVGKGTETAAGCDRRSHSFARLVVDCGSESWRVTPATRRGAGTSCASPAD